MTQITLENHFGEFMSRMTGVLHDYQILYASTDKDDHENLWVELQDEVRDIIAIYFDDPGEEAVQVMSDSEYTEQRLMNTEKFELVIDGSSGDEFMERAFADRLVGMFEIFKRKHHDYGRGNIGNLGERGVYVRLFDKLQRLKQLVWLAKEARVKDESVMDTYLDIANYGVIATLLHTGVWPTNE